VGAVGIVLAAHPGGKAAPDGDGRREIFFCDFAHPATTILSEIRYPKGSDSKRTDSNGIGSA
jgi:hypothetical protein